MVCRLGPVDSARAGHWPATPCDSGAKGGAHFETSSELSDWNSNLQATIAQPPREPGDPGPKPRRFAPVMAPHHAASSTGPAQTSCRHGGPMRATPQPWRRSDADQNAREEGQRR